MYFKCNHLITARAYHIDKNILLKMHQITFNLFMNSFALMEKNNIEKEISQSSVTRIISV